MLRRSPRRLATFLVLSLLLAGCATHRTVTAADEAPFPDGWLTRETSEEERAGEAPKVTVRLTYPAERAPELAESLWSAFSDGGWEVTVLKHPTKGDGPQSTFSGLLSGGQNDAVTVLCGVNEGYARRGPEDPAPVVCVFDLQQGGV